MLNLCVHYILRTRFLSCFFDQCQPKFIESKELTVIRCNCCLFCFKLMHHHPESAQRHRMFFFLLSNGKNLCFKNTLSDGIVAFKTHNFLSVIHSAVAHIFQKPNALKSGARLNTFLLVEQYIPEDSFGSFFL